MNRTVLAICITVVACAAILSTWSQHRAERRAETARVEYCMRFAPYATLDELTACLTQARE